MFTPKSPNTNQVGLEKAIDNLYAELNGFTADAEEYAKITDQLKKLYELKTLNKPERVSKDTLAVVLGNIFGIVMIVGHERAHVVTSKALSFVLKTR
jgi:hypothetical protein